MLQGNIDVGADLLVSCDGLQQPGRNLVRISVKKSHPAQILNVSQFLQQERQSVLQIEVFAIAGRILPDESDFSDAGTSQPLRFRYDRFETPRAELSAQLRNDAEAARVVAAFGNLDVRRVPGSREDARRGFVVQI